MITQCLYAFRIRSITEMLVIPVIIVVVSKLSTDSFRACLNDPANAAGNFTNGRRHRHSDHPASLSGLCESIPGGVSCYLDEILGVDWPDRDQRCAHRCDNGPCCK